MTGIADWLDLMPDTVVVEPFVGRDAYGVASYGAATPYPARVDFRSRLVRVSETEQSVSRGRAWLGTVDPMTTQGRITLSDASEPLILTLEQIPDENGPLYTSIDFA